MNLNLTQTKILNTPKGPLEFTDSGSGNPILAIHGAMGGYDQSQILARTVAPANTRIIAVSRPGYLGTPLQTGASPEEQADLYALLLDSLGLEKTTLLAISGGGYSSLTFAQRHPQRCQALILCSAPSGPMTKKPPAAFKILTFLARFKCITRKLQKKTEQNFRKTLERSIQFPDLVDALLSDTDTLSLYKELTLGMFPNMKQRLAGTLNDIKITQKLSYPLKELKVPTLVIHGTHDPVVPFEEHGLRHKAEIPNVDFFPVDRGEHVAIFTHRSAVREKIQSFLSSQNII